MIEQTIFDAVTVIIPALPTRSRTEGEQTAIFYDDDRIHICRRIPEHTFEVSIDIPGQGPTCVYKAQVNAKGERQVEICRRGRWVTHLVVLAERAREIRRREAAETLNAERTRAPVDDEALFPEFNQFVP